MLFVNLTNFDNKILEFLDAIVQTIGLIRTYSHHNCLIAIFSLVFKPITNGDKDNC